MKFGHASCTICNQSIFLEEELVAYQIRSGMIVSVQLNGQQPWAGVRCACRRCIKAIHQFAQETAHEPTP